MSDLTFLETVKLMPADYQQEVKDFIEFVWEKKMGKKPFVPEQRIPGLFKGKMWMSPDFDEPLEDFKDYM
ncbi:MAG: type II toxin-antitoxin system VapB family antitoxin [Segetibacter sp.]